MAKGGNREPCTVDGCGRTRVGWGFCALHYGRFMRSGSPRPTHRSQARAETMAADGTRMCFKCGNRKPFTESFFPKDSRRDGLKGTCIECLKVAVRRSTVARRYSVSLEQVGSVLADQGGACAVCNIPLDRLSKTSVPHIDHDHATGKVRGVLCHHCNVLLGHAKDSPSLLRAAIAYLSQEAVQSSQDKTS